MYYMAYLYEDTGAKCYEQFAEYPQLTELDAQPSDSMMVMLAKNPVIIWQVALTVVMLIATSLYCGVRIFNIILNYSGYGDEIAEVKDKCTCDFCCSQCFVVSIVSVFCMLCASYYLCFVMMPVSSAWAFDIAPSFHKDSGSFMLGFWLAGIVSWCCCCCVCCVACCTAIIY